MEFFIILFAVMVAWAYTTVKIHQILCQQNQFYYMLTLIKNYWNS